MDSKMFEGHPIRSRGVHNGDGLPTHYAPAKRATPDELRSDLRFIADDPIIDALMESVTGLVAVLNEQRQVLVLNARLLQLLGLPDAEHVLGLRLGETVGCVHADGPPSGCGTTEYCSTCGAAIAQVTSLAEDTATEQTCAIDLKRPVNGSEQLVFKVQACPVRRGTRRILLLFLQDVSAAQNRAALDRTFFHDVKNTVCALLTAAELVALDTTRPDAQIAAALLASTRRLAREIELQRCVADMAMDRFQRLTTAVSVSAVLGELARSMEHHPEAAGRTVHVAPAATNPPPLHTDETLLMRVLQNMVINALEATPVGGTVRVWTEGTPTAIDFCVWNSTAIAPDVARRVFQRNFSTKSAFGRGLGTYSMKLLGERLLGGFVSFTTDAKLGTCFRFSLPLLDPVRQSG